MSLESEWGTTLRFAAAKINEDALEDALAEIEGFASDHGRPRSRDAKIEPYSIQHAFQTRDRWDDTDREAANAISSKEKKLTDKLKKSLRNIPIVKGVEVEYDGDGWYNILVNLR